MPDTEIAPLALFVDRGLGMVRLTIARDGLPLYPNLAPPPSAADLLQRDASDLDAAPGYDSRGYSMPLRKGGSADGS